MATRSALLIVDVQKDFCAGGALPVPHGDRIVEPLNRLADAFTRTQRPVYASRDWHPQESAHFAPYGGAWPVHCVANTRGAEFHDALNLHDDTIVITKGQSVSDDGYSVFQGHTSAHVRFEADLRRRQVTHLYVGGLATDYCVRHSVLDARHAGLEVSVVRDAVEGVNVTDGDASRALDEMRAAGARLTTVSEILRVGGTQPPTDLAS